MQIEEIMDRNFTKIGDEYKKLVLNKDKCRKCSVYQHYEQVVQSEGNAEDPIFLFIGEGPGKDEAEQVRPFIGRAGQRLRAELRKYPEAFRKDTVLITNVISCRPLNNKFPGGDKSKEVETCTTNWLNREIEMLRPKVLVTLGNPALKYVRDEWGITANRGKWKFLPKYKTWSFPTYHPSYVLRSANSGDDHVVHRFEEDIKTVATTWKTIVNSDSRMAMNDDEWSRYQAMQKISEMGLSS